MAETPSGTSIPISNLLPSLSHADKKTIKAIVTLIWPYSSSTRTCALLLVEPDFRLRRKKGQVRVQLSGTCARRVAESGIGIGDEVNLSLDGATWSRDDGAIQTPGKSVGWELRFEQKLHVEIRKESRTHTVLNVERSSPPADSSPAVFETTNTTLKRVQSHSGQWSSPAFAKHRTSGGPYDPGIDPFHDRETKRRRTSWRDSNEWKLVDGGISPSKGDALLADDEESLLYTHRSPIKSPIQQKSQRRGMLTSDVAEPIDEEFANWKNPDSTTQNQAPIRFNPLRNTTRESPSSDPGDESDALAPSTSFSSRRDELIISSRPVDADIHEDNGFFDLPNDDLPSESSVSSSGIGSEAMQTEIPVDDDDEATDDGQDLTQRKSVVHDRKSYRYVDTMSDQEDEAEEDDKDEAEAEDDVQEIAQQKLSIHVEEVAGNLRGEHPIGDPYAEHDEEDEIGNENENRSKDDDSMAGIEEELADWSDGEVDSERFGSDTEVDEDEDREVVDEGEHDDSEEDDESEHEALERPPPRQQDTKTQASPVIIDLMSDSDEDTEEEDDSADHVESSARHVPSHRMGLDGAVDSLRNPFRTPSLQTQRDLPQLDTRTENLKPSQQLSAPPSSSQAPLTPTLNLLASPALPLISPFPTEPAPLPFPQINPTGSASTNRMVDTSYKESSSPNAIIANRPESVFSLQSHLPTLQENNVALTEEEPGGRPKGEVNPLKESGVQARIPGSVIPSDPQIIGWHGSVHMDIEVHAIDAGEDRAKASERVVEAAFEGYIENDYEEPLSLDHMAEVGPPEVVQYTHPSLANSTVERVEDIDIQDAGVPPYQGFQYPSIPASKPSDPLNEERIVETEHVAITTPEPSTKVGPSQSSVGGQSYGFLPSTVTTIIDLGSDDVEVDEDEAPENTKSIVNQQPPLLPSADQTRDVSMQDNAIPTEPDADGYRLSSTAHDNANDTDHAPLSSSPLSSFPDISQLTPLFPQHKSSTEASSTRQPKVLKGVRRSAEGILYVKDSEESSVLSGTTISTLSTDTIVPEHEEVSGTARASVLTSDDATEAPITVGTRTWKDHTEGDHVNRRSVSPPQESPITQFVPQRASTRQEGTTIELSFVAPSSPVHVQTRLSPESPIEETIEEFADQYINIGPVEDVHEPATNSAHGEDILAVLPTTTQKSPYKAQSQHIEPSLASSTQDMVDLTIGSSPPAREESHDDTVAVPADFESAHFVPSPPAIVEETYDDLQRTRVATFSPAVIQETYNDAMTLSQASRNAQDTIHLTISSYALRSEEVMDADVVSHPDLRTAQLMSFPPTTIRDTYDNSRYATLENEIATATSKAIDNEAFSPVELVPMLLHNEGHVLGVNPGAGSPQIDEFPAPEFTGPYLDLSLHAASTDYSAAQSLTLPMTPEPSQLENQTLNESSQLAQTDSVLPMTPELTQQRLRDLSFRTLTSDADKTSMADEDAMEFHPKAPNDDAITRVEQQITFASTKENVISNEEPKQSPKRFKLGRKSDVPRILSPWFAPSSADQRKSLQTKNSKSDLDIVEPQSSPPDSPSRNLRSHSSNAPKDESNTSIKRQAVPSAEAGDEISESFSKSNGLGSFRGLRTSLSYYHALLSIQIHLNRQIASLDILALCLTTNKRPIRTPAGPRDYYTSFFVTDTSIYPQRRNIQCFRPWKAALPDTDPGDVVMLREMKVRGYKTKKGESATGLYSSDGSAWCVWKFNEKANDNKPVWALKHDAGTSDGREEIKGPPVEIGDEERDQARSLRKWWCEQVKDEVAKSTTGVGLQEFDGNAVLKE